MDHFLKSINQNRNIKQYNPSPNFRDINLMINITKVGVGILQVL